MTKDNDGTRPTNPTDASLNRRNILLSSASLLALTATTATVQAEETKPAAAPAAAPPPGSGKPNILIIWGDDIGLANISAYSHGLMGYQTRTLTESPAKA